MSLPSADNPLTVLDGKIFFLVFLFCVQSMLCAKLTLVLICLLCWMGDFAWRPLVKQVGLAGGIVPLSVVVPPVGERG